jgi:hypothetical protein
MRSSVAFTRSVYHQAQARDVFSHGEEDLDHYEDEYDLIDEFFAARWKRNVVQLFDDSHHGGGNGDGAAGTPPLSRRAAPQSQERGRSPTHGYGNGGKHSSGDGGVPSAPHRFRARSSLSRSPASIDSRPIARSSKPVNVLDGLPRDVMAYGGRNSQPFRSNVSLSSGIPTKTMYSSVCGDDHVMASGGRNSLPFRPNVSLSSGISTKTHSNDGGHDHVMASIGRNLLPARSNVPRDVMSSFGSNSLPARSNVPRDVVPSIGSNSLLARSSPRHVMSSIGSKSLPARSNVPRDVMPSIGSNSLPARSNALRDVMPSIGSNSLSARSSPRDVMSSSGRNSLPARPTVPMTNGQPTRNHSAPMEISFDEIFPNSSAPVHVELSYPMPWSSSSPSVTCEGGSGWPPGAVFPGGGGCGAGGPGWPQGGGAPGWPQGAGGPGWPPDNGGPSGSERPGGSGSSRGQAVQGGRMAVQHRTQLTPVCYLCGEEGHDNPFCTKNREHASSCAKGNPSFIESILLKRKGDASKEGILLLQNNGKVSVCRDADDKCIEEVEYVSNHTAALHSSHGVPSRLCVTNDGGEYGFQFDDGLDPDYGPDVFCVPSHLCVDDEEAYDIEYDDGSDVDDDGSDPDYTPHVFCSCLEGNKCGGAALEVVEEEQHDPFPYAGGGDKGGAEYDDHSDPSRYTSPLGARFADAGVPQDPSHNIVGDVASIHHYRAGASVL